MKKYQNVERSLFHPRQEAPLCTFCLLFSEYQQMLKKKYESDYQTIQNKLEQMGKKVGIRLYEIICLRERRKRENKLLEQLKFIQITFWKQVFGKPPDSLEKLRDRQYDYLIRDESPLLLRYSAESRISAASFMVDQGILQGVFETCGFNVKISYQFHTDEREQSQYPHTIFIFSFDETNPSKF